MLHILGANGSHKNKFSFQWLAYLLKLTLTLSRFIFIAAGKYCTFAADDKVSIFRRYTQKNMFMSHWISFFFFLNRNTEFYSHNKWVSVKNYLINFWNNNNNNNVIIIILKIMMMMMCSYFTCNVIHIHICNCKCKPGLSS